MGAENRNSVIKEAQHPLLNSDNIQHNTSMDDPLMQEFLGWGIGDNGEFPDLDYYLLDPTVDGLSPDIPDYSLDELIEISGAQPATHDENCVAEKTPPVPESAMTDLINQLLSRVITLEAQ
jgi:hypothetical protein